MINFVDRQFTGPRWFGEPIAGKTILLHSDEGLGATIQFLRYARARDPRSSGCTSSPVVGA